MDRDDLQSAAPAEAPEPDRSVLERSQPGDTPARDPQKIEDSTTVRLPQPEHDLVTPRWGAVLDDVSRRLAFTLAGRAEPVVVTCTQGIIIGRSSRAGAPPDFDLGPYSKPEHGISRHHAKIWYDADMFKLVDLGSTNGTFLNGLRLPARQPRILRDGDEVTFGRLSVRIHMM